MWFIFCLKTFNISFYATNHLKMIQVDISYCAEDDSGYVIFVIFQSVNDFLLKKCCVNLLPAMQKFSFYFGMSVQV